MQLLGFATRASHVYLFTCERYLAGSMVLTAKSLNAVTNFPNTRSISGSSVPAAMAAMKAMPFSSQLVLSAYLKTRYHGVRRLNASQPCVHTKYGPIPPCASPCLASLSIEPTVSFSSSLLLCGDNFSASSSDDILGTDRCSLIVVVHTDWEQVV